MLKAHGRHVLPPGLDVEVHETKERGNGEPMLNGGITYACLYVLEHTMSSFVPAETILLDFRAMLNVLRFFLKS